MKTNAPQSSALRRRYLAPGLCLVAILALGGCAKDVDTRGNLPTRDALSQLAIGEQTRQDVQALLGTPATTAIFDNETWYYISSHTTEYAFYHTNELDRTVYAVSFDQHGILKSVRKLDMTDGYAVQMAPGATPTKGREYTILEQLLGNVGRMSGPIKAPGPE